MWSNGMNKQAVIKVVADQVATEVNGEIVILNTKTGIYFGLNAMGSDIWQRIQEPTRVADVQSAIIDEYDAPADRIEQDVDALLEKLAEAGLIEVEHESAQ